MSVWAVSMVRDEADVIEGTIRHMAGEVDQMLVADNGSVDGTREILDRLTDDLPLTVVDDPDPAYYQSAKMTTLADKAHAAGAVWVVPFDADEIWHAPDRVRDVLGGRPAEETVCWAMLHNHLRTAVDPDDPDPIRSMVWRQRGDAPLAKVAVRWRPGCVIAQGNHDAQHPDGAVGVPALSICHFPARSAAQFARKGINGAAAYAAADLPADMGNHWRSYGQLVEQYGASVLEEIFRQHWWYLSPTDAGLFSEPAPYRRWEVSDATEEEGS